MKQQAAIQDTLLELKEEFAFMGDWRERFQFIIDLGRSLPPLPKEFYTDQYKVDGCVSQVWMEAHTDNGRVVFQGDSDAAIVKGLVALMIRIYSNHTPDEILAVPPDFLVEMGITTHLTPNRTNGLASMAKRVMTYASAFKTIGDSAP